MFWIEGRGGEDIPYELFYDNYQIDKDKRNKTPLMLWTEYRRSEAIPSVLPDVERDV